MPTSSRTKARRVNLRRVNYWDRIFAWIDAQPTFVPAYGLVTDERGVAHRVMLQQTFRVDYGVTGIGDARPSIPMHRSGRDRV